MRRQFPIAGKSWRFPQVKIEAQAYFLAAALLLLLPLSWVGAAVTAAAVHELGHLAALWLLDIRVWCIQIGAAGAKIETEPLLPRQELICAVAGPLGGLLLCLFWKWIPRTAIWALMQTAFNLLPVYPLDGGRAVRAVRNLWIKDESLEKSVANKESSGYNNSN